jgi:flagellar hook protein FlgE
MLRSMFAAISGLKSHQMMLDVTANDIANVNTIGFKAGRTTFKDSLAQLQSGSSAPSGATGGSNAKQVGLGVQLGSIDNLMGGGALQSTGNVLDVAIQGEGWFRVGSGAPPAVPTVFQYTRAGNFTTNQQGYLVTQDGSYVMGRTAPGAGGTDTYLQIPSGSTNASIGQDGSVSYDPPGGGTRVVAGYISLAKFANEAGLERASSNRWNASSSSGAEQVDTAGSIGYGLTTSGAVEMSNVDLASEFTNMITAQRGFQANSRVISTADEILQDLVNLKR